MKIGTKSIGDKSSPGGIVAASNYFTIPIDRPIYNAQSPILHIQNNGNIPELWSTLENGDPQWRVTREPYYNLISMTAGQQN
jgi:hypothetical protein